jgi:predicted GH43/DUF377 family glycosyl hydrolase
MKWLKKGLIFQIGQDSGWMRSHAQVPTVYVKNDRLRVYFATRPRRDLSMTTFVDLDISDFSKVLYLNPEPILSLGKPGTFDENGIMPSSIIEKDGLVYLYYSGWSRGGDFPYRNYMGLAISEDGGASFRKNSTLPIIGGDHSEPYSATSPCVFYHNSAWHMWYSSGLEWIKINGKQEHTYDLKYARSGDAINWNRTNETAIAQRDRNEAITKPTVVRLNGTFHMWYCYRGSKDFRGGMDAYRIGYATSSDLRKWVRNDKMAGIDISSSGWDSEMIAYPCIGEIGGQLVMFYNGNQFGSDGFGYALLDN